MHKLDNFDTIKLNEAKKVIAEVCDYNFISNRDPLSAKLATVLKKLDHILEEYGEK